MSSPLPTRYTAAGVISLVAGGLAVLLQYIVTPLSGGSMTGTELVAKVTEHHTAMAWALALDPLVLLAAPAFLFIGYLAHARTSVLASIATAALFFPFVVSLPPAFGLDALAFFAGTEPNPEAMAHLVDSWQDSAWFVLGLVPYVVLQVVGSILMGIALFRAKTVPTWVAAATGAWPLLAVAGQAGGVRAFGIAGYALLFAAWAGCALSMLREHAVPGTATNPSHVVA